MKPNKKLQINFIQTSVHALKLLPQLSIRPGPISPHFSPLKTQATTLANQFPVRICLYHFEQVEYKLSHLAANSSLHFLNTEVGNMAVLGGICVKENQKVLIPFLHKLAIHV